jgi:hypothetical protein
MSPVAQVLPLEMVEIAQKNKREKKRHSNAEPSESIRGTGIPSGKIERLPSPGLQCLCSKTRFALERRRGIFSVIPVRSPLDIQEHSWRRHWNPVVKLDGIPSPGLQCLCSKTRSALERQIENIPLLSFRER